MKSVFSEQSEDVDALGLLDEPTLNAFILGWIDYVHKKGYTPVYEIMNKHFQAHYEMARYLASELEARGHDLRKTFAEAEDAPGEYDVEVHRIDYLYSLYRGRFMYQRMAWTDNQ